MQYNNGQDEMFDTQKYYFPAGALDLPRQQSQPGLEVTPERDEQGTPGLQPVPDEQKFSNVAVGELRDRALSQRPNGAAQVDEVSSQGLQAVSVVESPQLAQSQPQSQLQYQWSEPGLNQYYGQTFQSASTANASAYPNQYPPPNLQPGAWNADSQQFNPHSPTSQNFSSIKDEQQAGAGGNTGRRRWVWWTVGAAVLILVIIGAVVGGVMGGRAAAKSGGGSKGTTSSDTSTPLQSIRTGSRLAVTGYRGKSDFSYRLFYQDVNNQLRYSDKENSNGNWTESTVLDTLPYLPKVNGTIAAGSYMYGNPAPKLEFFYEDKDSVVRGQLFNFGFENGTLPTKGDAGSLNAYPLPIAQGNTCISSYFPHIVSLDNDNAVRWTSMLGQNTSNLSAPWWINDTQLDIKASEGSGLVVLPAAQEYVNIGVVYRSSEGKLSIKIRDEAEASSQGIAWTKGTLSQDIPADTSIGAFAVGRPYDNTNQINTYILYQDEEDVIQVVWQDDASGWKGPQTFDALSGAIPRTELACLTPGADEAMNIPITREQDMNRCFFQVSGGRVKEVWFDGSNWNDVGIVPML
ncbi:hypothetical protein F5B20DRAFT_529699 [Whalleya microplaca]|nr:hypothetical protein F5B20DRAFT_529699 [Whalleya microplaca]